MRGQDIEAELINAISGYRHDPLGFIQFAFPWGQQGTSIEKMIGPTLWQAEQLIDIGRAVRGELNNGNTVDLLGIAERTLTDEPPEIRRKGRFATASGKGIGKSCLVAWVCLWGLCTFPDTRIRLTAGTDTQLRTTTMPEVAKWFNLLICKHWFKMTATSIYSADPDHEKNWRLDAIPWNEQNPEAFAGLHNLGKRIVFVMDEASQIADPIFDTTDGIMSDADTEVIWCCFGNPTRGIGRFREAAEDPRWNFRSIDSRTVPVTDKAELKALVDKMGEDSDYVRVNVRGLFPRVATTQFIAMDVVRAARKNEAVSSLNDPLILGVDVARYGKDNSVICPRRGRDARTIPWKTISGQSVIEVGNAVIEMYKRLGANAVHVDGGGVGGGVVDYLRSQNIPVMEVQPGGKADGTNRFLGIANYANKRTEMWGVMRDALPTLAIPDDNDLERELVSALYGYRNDKDIQLVPKEIMLKQHKIESPDHADALALTYAFPVQPLLNGSIGGGLLPHDNTPNKAKTDYDPFANYGA